MKYLKAFCDGYGRAWRANMKRIKEAKWYIIPVVLNIILSPLIVAILLIMSVTKGGRELIMKLETSILEED